MPPGPEARAGTLGLIDFLADYDARRNPPVRDIAAHGLFLLRDGALPAVPGVSLTPAAGAWLTVDVPDRPRRPGVPEDRAAAAALHRELFRQRELVAANRESLELVWGFGRLRWRPGGVPVDHPLVCVPVEVEQDRPARRIRVRPAGPPEVEARCLAGLPLADRARFTAIGRSVSEEGADPWDRPALHDLLWSLVRAIGHDGALVERAQPPGDGAPAVTDASWVLFLRLRLPDHQGFLEQMRVLYRDPSVPVPGTLRAVVSDAPPARAGQAPDDAGPLLCPLPANEEQQAVLTRARLGPGVVVAAPPGTGASHTIANIISDHAAHGKRVLVVAGKERALRALAGVIPAGIRDLTVSLLGADAESGRELASATGKIRARAGGQDPALADERIRQLTADLDAADRDAAATAQALAVTREAEAERLPGSWAAGDAPTRAEAARWVAAGRSRLGYIDDVLAPSAARPLSAGELGEFLRLIRQVGAGRADACARLLPDLTAIPFAAELEDRFAEQARLEASVRALGDAVQDWGLAAASGRDGLRALAARCHAEMEWMAKTAGTWLGQVREQVQDPLLARDWQEFSARLTGDREEALRLRGVLTAYRVAIPDVIEPWLIDGLEQAKERLSELGKLGMFAGPAKRALAECQVDGRPLRTVADIDVCLRQAALEGLRERMRTSWHNQVARVGGADLDAGPPEDVLGPLLEDLGRVLAWPRAWAQVRADLAAAGVGGPAAADADTLRRLADVCVQACDQIGAQELARRLHSLGEWLRAGAGPAAASPLWGRFADALARQDLARWHELREELRDLQEIAPQGRWLRELRGRLAAAAPAWTERVLADPAAAGDPADYDAAWQWRQLDSWVREALAGPTPAELQARLGELSARRRRVLADLVSERAWRHLVGAPGAPADAIPVWIMSAARALTRFRPRADPPFDLLVVDGASHVGLEAVPLLALAGKAIVIGDDRLTGTEDAGLSRREVSGLLDEHLAMVPAYRTRFDPGNTLYDVAAATFPDVVTLTEHFGCLPQIIGFANARAYDGRLVPLRDLPPRPGWHAVGAVKVTNGRRIGMLNEPEADAVADLAAELCADPGYDGMDIGVISLLGSAQSRLIWDKLYDRLGPEVIDGRRLRCAEPAGFLGDARDVIIISAVDAADPAAASGRVAAMTGSAASRHVNVAATRARQQMWIVYSAEPGRFADGDPRGALIRHCRDAGTAPARPADPAGACASAFERDVLKMILARGYRAVWVQHGVGRYRVGIAVEGPRARVAVECEPEGWPGPGAWPGEQARQQALERAGWTVERIRGSAFYLDPDAALTPLWTRLADLGIPVGEWRPGEASRPAGREVAGPAPVPQPGPASLLPGPAPLPPGPAPGERPVLFPYRSWTPRALPHPDTAPPEVVTAGLREIVAAEGPIHAQRAYRLYALAAGGRRVGPEMRRAFHAATLRALQAGEIRQLDDEAVLLDNKTLYPPGGPTVLVRELGPRRLSDVPRSEVAKLVRYLGLAGATEDAVKRAVLEAYGLVRLTARTSQYLDECLRYRLRRPAAGQAGTGTSRRRTGHPDQ